MLEMVAPSISDLEGSIFSAKLKSVFREHFFFLFVPFRSLCRECRIVNRRAHSDGGKFVLVYFFCSFCLHSFLAAGNIWWPRRASCGRIRKSEKLLSL